MNNPVFHYELRRLRWPRAHSIRWLQGYIRRISFVVPLILGLLAGGLSLVASRFAFWFIFPVVAICVLVTLAADMYYVLITINSISRQIESGHWEMLRVTTLDERQIIAAQYAVAQIRAWRVAAGEVGLRTFLGITVLVSVGYYQIAYGSRYWDTLDSALSIASLVGVIIVFIAEPIWRMQTISAIALAVSASGSNIATAALTAFGSVMGLHIVEVSLIWSMMFTSFRILQTIALYRYDLVVTNLSTCLSIILTTALLAAFFRFVQRLALRRALYAAFRNR